MIKLKLNLNLSVLSACTETIVQSASTHLCITANHEKENGQYGRAFRKMAHTNDYGNLPCVKS